MPKFKTIAAVMTTLAFNAFVLYAVLCGCFTLVAAIAHLTGGGYEP